MYHKGVAFSLSRKMNDFSRHSPIRWNIFIFHDEFNVLIQTTYINVLQKSVSVERLKIISFWNTALIGILTSRFFLQALLSKSFHFLSVRRDQAKCCNGKRVSTQNRRPSNRREKSFLLAPWRLSWSPNAKSLLFIAWSLGFLGVWWSR